MTTVEAWSTIKSAWGEGPWQGEPTGTRWTDAATGLTCMTLRNPVNGTLNGYVALPEGHPWHGQDYDQIDPFIEVHGHLTFLGSLEDFADPGTWWVGFDCGHSFDYAPGRGEFNFVGPESYRTLDYVRAECASLARQVFLLSPLVIDSPVRLRLTTTTRELEA